MGDVFRTGNQNVIAEINNTKISTKEFIEYLQKINITREELDSRGKEEIINEILTNYISEKIITIETEEKGILLTDNSLKKILVSDEGFKKDGKFTRTKYEKFLISNGITAPQYEKNLSDLEGKGQLLSFYSGGIKLPNFIIDDLYKQENNTKEITFLDLKKIYTKQPLSQNEISEFYNKNKEFFKSKYRSFNYLELSPELISEQKDYNKVFFDKLDEIENQILDGKNFSEITRQYEIKVNKILNINIKNIKKDGNTAEVDMDLVKEVFKVNDFKSPSFINLESKFYIIEVLNEVDDYLKIENKSVQDLINQQINLVKMLEENSKIVKKIQNGNFGENEMRELSLKHNVQINKGTIKNIEDISLFNKNLVKQIYNYKGGQIFIITDFPKVEKNFLVLIDKQTDPIVNKESDIYKKYINKANKQYISKVYKSYDSYINSIYKININEKVFERIVNSI